MTPKITSLVIRVDNNEQRVCSHYVSMDVELDGRRMNVSRQIDDKEDAMDALLDFIDKHIRGKQLCIQNY